MYRKIVENRLVSEIKVIKRLHPELNMDSLFSADELAKAVDKITADTYNVKSGARPAVTAVSKFIDSKLLSHFSRMAKHTDQTKTNAPPQNTNDRTFHGCGQFFYSDNFTLIKQI